jgi:2-desacetyl-2-hydroxyethyl bacteriochlorophyllide A dehydrogenase
MAASTASRGATALWFVAPRRAELIAEDLPAQGPDEVTVRAVASLVSSGTEMLIYRGEVAPDDDLGLETAVGSFGFPIKYAYQVVGEVIDAGVDTDYRPGDLVFARHPHQDVFVIREDSSLLFRLPPDLNAERAIFANLLDVALNANLDVPTRHGDCVVVHGQGIVGSLCAQLARRTAGKLIVVDPFEPRRRIATAWGADAAVAPEDAAEVIAELTGGRGADISIEASGAPSALQSAIRTTGQEGTIAAVSFFGRKTIPLVLAPEFHYRRQRIISTQVSSIGSGLQPRWSFERRMETTFDLLRSDYLETDPLLSHRLPFSQAPEAYTQLDERGVDTLGVLLTYPEG